MKIEGAKIFELKRRIGIAPRRGEKVECLCWCEEEVVIIPVSWVSKGRTRSCGDAACRAMDKYDDFDE